jgi:hypothetical protein
MIALGVKHWPRGCASEATMARAASKCARAPPGSPSISIASPGMDPHPEIVRPGSQVGRDLRPRVVAAARLRERNSEIGIEDWLQLRLDAAQGFSHRHCLVHQARATQVKDEVKQPVRDIGPVLRVLAERDAQVVPSAGEPVCRLDNR